MAVEPCEQHRPRPRRRAVANRKTLHRLVWHRRIRDLPFHPCPSSRLAAEAANCWEIRRPSVTTFRCGWQQSPAWPTWRSKWPQKPRVKRYVNGPFPLRVRWVWDEQWPWPGRPIRPRSFWPLILFVWAWDATARCWWIRRGSIRRHRVSRWLFPSGWQHWRRPPDRATRVLPVGSKRHINNDNNVIIKPSSFLFTLQVLNHGIALRQDARFQCTESYHQSRPEDTHKSSWQEEIDSLFPSFFLGGGVLFFFFFFVLNTY